MEDQAKIVRLTVAIIGGCVGIVLLGLVVIAVRYDGDTAKDIVGTFTNIAVTSLGALGAVISAYVIAHRPTPATVAQAALGAVTAPVSQVTASQTGVSVSASPAAASVSVDIPEASDAASG